MEIINSAVMSNITNEYLQILVREIETRIEKKNKFTIVINPVIMLW